MQNATVIDVVDYCSYNATNKARKNYIGTQ